MREEKNADFLDRFLLVVAATTFLAMTPLFFLVNCVWVILLEVIRASEHILACLGNIAIAFRPGLRLVSEDGHGRFEVEGQDDDGR